MRESAPIYTLEGIREPHSSKLKGPGTGGESQPVNLRQDEPLGALALQHVLVVLLQVLVGGLGFSVWRLHKAMTMTGCGSWKRGYVILDLRSIPESPFVVPLRN